MATPHKLGISLLSLSILAGIYCLHGLGWTGGLIPKLQSILHDPSGKWPGSDALLLRSYTGATAIDVWLSNLNPFFAHVVDGSDPSLSLFSFFMFGQYGVAWGLCVMESLRAGNAGRAVSYILIFGIIMQTIGFAIIFPTYLLFHLLKSPVAKLNPAKHSGSILYIPPASLAVIPLSITIGYIIPSILMALPSPSVVTIETRQNFIAAWQVFPLHTVLAQWILSTIYPLLFPSTQVNAASSKTSSRSVNYLTAASRVYAFLLGFAILTHITALLITICPTPLLNDLLPSVATGITSSGVTFSSVYIPHTPAVSWRAINLAEGVHTFLWWDTYVSGLAAIVWAIALVSTVVNEQRQMTSTTSKSSNLSRHPGSEGAGRRSYTGLLAKIAFWALVAGPLGAVIMLLWDRDALMMRNSEHDS